MPKPNTGYSGRNRKHKSHAAHGRRSSVGKKGKKSRKRKAHPSNLEAVSTANFGTRPTPNGTLKQIDEAELLSTEKETFLHTPMAPTKRDGFGDTGGSGE